MQLSLNHDEISLLLEVIGATEVILSAQEENLGPQKLANFWQFHAKILNFAAKNGFSKILEQDVTTGLYRIKQKFIEDSKMAEFMDNFREENFWEELVIRLSDRELIKIVGQTKFDEMEESERRQVMAPLEKAYWQEFSTVGLDNIMVINMPNA